MRPDVPSNDVPITGPIGAPIVFSIFMVVDMRREENEKASNKNIARKRFIMRDLTDICFVFASFRISGLSLLPRTLTIHRLMAIKFIIMDNWPIIQHGKRARCA